MLPTAQDMGHLPSLPDKAMVSHSKMKMLLQLFSGLRARWGILVPHGVGPKPHGEARLLHFHSLLYPSVALPCGKASSCRVYPGVEYTLMNKLSSSRAAFISPLAHLERWQEIEELASGLPAYFVTKRSPLSHQGE